MTNPCNPVTPPNQMVGIIDPCATLPLLQHALFNLMTQPFVEVRMPDGATARYAQSSMTQLREQIAMLRGMCNDNGTPRCGGQAQQWQYRRPAGAPLGPAGFGPSRYRGF